MLTRNLQGMVANRVCAEDITLVYANEVDEYDGSATVTFSRVVTKASVTALQPKDIQRLQFAGQEIKDGVTIVLPFGTRRPDTVEHCGDAYRIVAWATQDGCAVCTGDKITVAAA